MLVIVIEGVDYSFTRPNPNQLVQAGKKFAMRYIGPGSSGKLLNGSERAALHAAGLSIVFLAEGAAGDMLKGFNTGRSQASLAEAHRQSLGAPALPIYFAADVDMSLANVPVLKAYCDGAASVIGRNRVGVYGEYSVMEWLQGSARWFFQTYAWSSGKWYGGNHVEQYRNGQSVAGGTVDLCRARVADYGQWAPPALPVAGGNDDMVMYVWCEGSLWGSNGATRFHVPNAAAAEAIKRAYAAYGWAWKDVQVTPAELGGFGVEVPAPAPGEPGEPADPAILAQLADGLSELADAIRDASPGVTM